MAREDLVNAVITAETNLDTVIIEKVIETVRGGRTLDVTGFADTVIQAGHVVFQNPDTKEFVPQPVDGSIPATATPDDYIVVGVLTGSILASEPSAAIMTRGTVNEVPLKYPIKAATKALLGDRIAYTITE
jgi:hypothetical protein